MRKRIRFTKEQKKLTKEEHKKIDLIIFKKNNKRKTIVRNCAFMKCPYCSEEVFLQTDKVAFCNTPKCRYLHRFAYKLRPANTPEGFDKVSFAEVKDYKKTTIWEAFENE